VLDEPVASLDPAGRRDFLRELVEQVLDRSTTVVFSTHILSDLERVAFNVAFLSRGRIALQAPLDELLEQARLVTGPAPALQAMSAGDGLQVLKRTRLDGGRERWLVRAANALFPMTGLQSQPVNLEDLFLELTA